MEQKHILVVEDDRNVAEGLRDSFSAQGYRTSLAENSREALTLLAGEPVDLVVLDVSLGADSGYNLCREIRQSSDIPILFLTARSSELELVQGFQCGGDDYLTKPFRLQELLVRIQALLRRSSRQSGGASYAGVLHTGALELDIEKCLVKRDGVIMGLSGVEWRLVSQLAARWPQVTPREELLYYVWDRDADYVEDNTLNVNISRLREKLGSWNGKPYIETVRGTGYRWAVPVER